MKMTKNERQRIANKKYYEANREKSLEISRAYYAANKEKVIQRSKLYRINNIEARKEYEKIHGKIYRELNIDKVKEYAKKNYESNKDEINSYKKEWYKKNNSRLKEKAKTYRDNNIDAIKEYNEKNKDAANKRALEKRKKYPLHALSVRLRNRCSDSIRRRGWGKHTKTQEMIGCDFETVKKHIEDQFTEGMTWENNAQYGWHIDHIIPLASAKTEEELIKLFHYTNLQPLWWRENLSKGHKLI